MSKRTIRKAAHPFRFSILLILCLFIQTVSAMDFQVKDIAVRAAVTRLQKQAGISIAVDPAGLDLDRKVSVNLKGVSVEEVVKQIFKGQSVSCTRTGNAIAVRHVKEHKANVKEKTVKISGVVTGSADGEPLIGATVFNKSTGKGAMTDIEGRYSIEAAPGNTLQISYVGFSPASVKVGSGSELDIALKDSENTLNEVVVVGFGQQKKVNITGAVAVIEGDEVNGRPVASAATALQGLDPSMNIGINSGRADAGYSINIRGAASLNSGTSDPLVLVDGIEMPLSRINPNDIESVSILKDASAQAVYGAKASAGVVLVTTKSGSESKISVSYNGRFGWAKNTTSTDYITSGYDWGRIVDMFNYNYSNQKYFKYDEQDWAELEARRYDKTENPDRPWVKVGEDGSYRYYGNFDWYGYLFRRTRPQQEHNVTVRGGNEKIRYYISGRYYKADGLMNIHNDPFRSYNFRAKLDVNIRKWLRFNTNVNYYNGKTEWVGFANMETVFRNTTYGSSPVFVPRNPDGSIVHLTDCVNQGASLLGDYNLLINTGNNRNVNEDNDISIRNGLEIDIFKGLTAHLSYSYRTKSEFQSRRRANAEYSRREGEMLKMTTGNFLNQLTERNSRTYRSSFEGYLDYIHNFPQNHNLKVMAGVQYETYRKRGNSATQDGLMSDILDDLDLAAGDTYELTDGKTRFRTLGVFGRVNYDWNGRYLLEISMRGDGSSRFRKGHRWGFFPSGSAGWRISEEPFWADMLSWWSNAKIRASVGSLGNQQVADFLFYDKITTGNISDGFTLNGGDPLQYAAESNPVASDLTWEKVTTYDVGVDLSFFNSRLNFTGDYYIRRTTNMMVPGAALPGVYGVSAPKENAADMRTNGWEIALRWRDRFNLAGRPASYSVNASVGDYQTVVTRFNNETRLIDGTNYKGQKLGEIWGYVVDGLFASDEEAAAYQQKVDCSYLMGRIMSKGANEYKRLVAGDLKYVDLDGDGKIGRGENSVDNPGDRRIIGNTLPRYSYTFGGDFSWIGIDFSILFQGVGKRDWYPGGGYSNLFWGPYCRPHGTFLSQQLVDQIWSPENPDGYFPFPRGMEAYSANPNSNFDRSNSHYTLTVPNTRYIQNCAYLRLKNLTVGYTLPWLRKYVEQIRIYFTAENLCYWSPLKKHCKYIDPEGAVSSSSTTTNSGEVYNFSKTFSVGLDITF